ncbi:MAG TPA: hypothetical protein VJ889_09185, partial [Pseudomonas sp.]|nr:hypothetical protein [Pseudomonas sp.]
SHDAVLAPVRGHWSFGYCSLKLPLQGKRFSPARLAFLLVKRIQRGVADSARNKCAKMFQVLLARGFARDRTVIASH